MSCIRRWSPWHQRVLEWTFFFKKHLRASDLVNFLSRQNATSVVLIGVICIKTIAFAFSDAKVSRRKLPQFLHHTLPILDFSLPDASHLPFHSAVIISHFIPHDMLRQARLGFSTTKAPATAPISIILHLRQFAVNIYKAFFVFLKCQKMSLQVLQHESLILLC